MIQQIAEIAFWNIMRKETVQYVQECIIYQKKEKYRKTDLDEVKRSEEM